MDSHDFLVRVKESVKLFPRVLLIAICAVVGFLVVCNLIVPGKGICVCKATRNEAFVALGLGVGGSVLYGVGMFVHFYVCGSPWILTRQARVLWNIFMAAVQVSLMYVPNFFGHYEAENYFMWSIAVWFSYVAWITERRRGRLVPFNLSQTGVSIAISISYSLHYENNNHSKVITALLLCISVALSFFYALFTVDEHVTRGVYDAVSHSPVDLMTVHPDTNHDKTFFLFDEDLQKELPYSYEIVVDKKRLTVVNRKREDDLKAEFLEQREIYAKHREDLAREDARASLRCKCASTTWLSFSTPEGKKCYYNVVTNQSQWAVPEGAPLKVADAFVEAHVADPSYVVLPQVVPKIEAGSALGRQLVSSVDRGQPQAVAESVSVPNTTEDVALPQVVPNIEAGSALERQLESTADRGQPQAAAETVSVPNTTEDAEVPQVVPNIEASSALERQLESSADRGQPQAVAETVSVPNTSEDAEYLGNIHMQELGEHVFQEKPNEEMANTYEYSEFHPLNGTGKDRSGCHLRSDL